MPVVQWQVSSNGNDWSNISGAVQPVYTFTAVHADNGKQYRAVWTNGLGFVYSDAATLTVHPMPGGILSAVKDVIFQGEEYELLFEATSGSQPFSLVINGVTYTGIEDGIPFSAGVTASSQISIWGNTSVPEPTHNDRSQLEVGVKFQSSVQGYIKGIRFYKATANTGVHTGKLWSSGGTLLASGIFVNETASGWQEMTFGTLCLFSQV